MIRKRLKKLVLCLAAGWVLLNAPAQNLSSDQGLRSFNTVDKKAQEWVDSVFNQLSPRQRIGQLFMAAAYSNKGREHRQEILHLVREYGIGGLVFFQGGPVRQANLTNRYQQASAVPLLIAMDAEWGLGMRLDSTINFPYQMALGAIQDDQLIYDMGKELALNFKRIGMHMNFAPVADVNNNPANPVINYRSFGEQREQVANKSIAFMKGMQDHGILATAKHFPGHGDTNVDSHYDLPVINHGKTRLDSLELFPFKRLINEGISSVMIAHMNIPALDSTANLPSTLSKPIVSGLLREKLNFEGLVVTDAMNMKGVTKHFAVGEADVRALQAGNDLIEFTEDIPKAIQAIRAAVQRGDLKQADIDSKCKKVLLAKYQVGLADSKPVEVKNLVEDLNNPRIKLVNQKLVEASITLLKNENGILPLKDLSGKKFASLSIGSKNVSAFQKMLEKYAKIDHYNMGLKASADEINRLEGTLSQYDRILVALHQVRRRPSNNNAYPLEVKRLVGRMAAGGKAIVTVFRNPYTLARFEGIEQSPALIMCYSQSEVSQRMAAQLIFGGIGARGKLPVTVDDHFKTGDGVKISGIGRFKYTLPEEAGMDSGILNRGIDSLMELAMVTKATPGGQILVAKEGKVVFHKAYGYHSYFDTVKVRLDDLYDLASVTKVTTSLPIIMKLIDEGKINLDDPLSQYVPELKNSNKSALTFRSILAHQARLEPWIPYWKSTIKKNNSGFKPKTFKTDSSGKYPLKIADNLYLHRNYKKKIFHAIKKSPLEPEPGYKYSGLAFYLFPSMIENMTGQDFESYLYAHFYRPLGATTLTYKPFRDFPISQIVPTEFDLPFRQVVIHGRVHDEGAAMMDGISSNAGLFSNANDLAKLFQMYMNMGEYGGKRFVSETTMKEFTRYQFPENNNRRGLGFDKPALTWKANGNAAKDASPESFGHTGFTGTRAWADPKHQLVYIFLSNRVHPTRSNTRLYRLNTRTEIEQVIYDSMK